MELDSMMIFRTNASSSAGIWCIDRYRRLSISLKTDEHTENFILDYINDYLGQYLLETIILS